MSPSSRGYYVQMDGKFLRSTVIVQCSPPPPAVAEPDLEDHPLPPLGEFEDDAESEAAGGEMEVLQEGREDNRETFVEEVDPQLRECEPKAAPTRRRLHGKQHVPVICAMSTKGEWTWSVDFSEEQEAEGQEYKSYAPKERQAWESFDTMVHAELRQVVLEERNYTDYPDVAEVVRQMEEEVTLLEKRLAKFEKIEEEEMQQWTEESGGFSELVESSYPPECLVTQTITMEEVRKHLMEWTPALRSEYQSLLGHGAIKPITEAQFQATQQDEGLEVEVLPSLLVATRKPPKRLKARIVACGNFAAGAGIASADNAAGGCDNGTVRLLVSTSAHHGWSISTVDVRIAFLQAPRRPTPGKSTVVQPPQILKEANVLGSTTERWEVTGALYGLVESPRDWNDFRNSKMQEMAWHSPSGDLFLEKTPRATFMENQVVGQGAKRWS